MERDEIEYFFDTYSIVEIINGNSGYEEYLGKPATITIFNLAEIYWVALREYTEEKANEIFSEYSKCVVKIPEEVLKDAIKFRKANKKKDLSYADCIGYIYALRNKMKFLTGDKEFEVMKNVEFVK
ncbi:MAG TPA: PIN domain-containing protein [Candidatus Nanoarchaeia archaeon]|nr:PIN domain-containing protein [Candidatus Nanoarchaeia archaeon]